MTFNLMMARAANFIGVTLLILLTGCALNPKRITSLEERIVQADSEIVKLKTELEATGFRVGQMEAQLQESSSKLVSIQTELNANTQETYLRVVVPILNIRTSPSTATNNIIAKAEEGAYLRKLSHPEGGNQWIKVEFVIDNYPYIGYVYNDNQFFKEEVYDPITFGRLANRKLIKYQWEIEAAIEMRSNAFKTLGVFVKTQEPYRADRFLGHLAKIFRDYKIYVKPIDSFNINQISQQCARHNVEGIMALEIDGAAGPTPQMDIKLFDKNSVILYSAILPMQAIELPDNLGTR